MSNQSQGKNALENILDGLRNISFGDNSSQMGTGICDTIAIGHFALSDNLVNENVAIGTRALRNNTTGSKCIAIGHQSLLENNTACENTGIGWCVLQNNMTGNSNVGFGTTSLQTLENGHCNSAFGTNSGSKLISGSLNVLVGYESGYTLLSGNKNVVIGAGANVSQSDGIDRIAIGNNAIAMCNRDVQMGSTRTSTIITRNDDAKTLNDQCGTMYFRDQIVSKERWINGEYELPYIDCFGNLCKGQNKDDDDLVVTFTCDLNMCKKTLFNLTSISTDTIYSNVKNKPVYFKSEPIVDYTNDSKNQFWGYKSGKCISTGINNSSIGHGSLEHITLGNDNTANGYNSLHKLTMGVNNTACGRSSLEMMTSGTNNTAIGRLSHWKCQDGNRNTSVGSSSLLNNETGNDITAIGFKSLQMSTRDFNTALGSETGINVTTGTNNVIIGQSAASAGVFSNFNAIPLKSGSRNVFIGSNADAHAENIDESIAIGYKSLVGNGGVAIGYNTESTGVNSIAIGTAAIATMKDCIQLGEGTVSGKAKLNFKSQVIGDECWIDGKKGIALIDEAGNMTKSQITIKGDNCVVSFGKGTLLYQLKGETNENQHKCVLSNSPKIPMGVKWFGRLDVIGSKYDQDDSVCDDSVCYINLTFIAVGPNKNSKYVEIKMTSESDSICVVSVSKIVPGYLDIVIDSSFLLSTPNEVNSVWKWTGTLWITQV
jgi:hypothetical protein